MVEFKVLLFEKNGEKLIWFSMLPIRILKDFEEDAKLISEKKISKYDFLEIVDDFTGFLSSILGKKLYTVKPWESPMGFEWGGKIGMELESGLLKEVGEYNFIDLYGFIHVKLKGEIVNYVIKYYNLSIK